MLTGYILPLVFIGVFGLIGFFWFWWAAPRAQVPPHLEADDLKRLELQDRLRQTNYQVLTGIGLVATFFATLAQLTLTSQQWSSDHELRLRHEQDQQFAEASKVLITAKDIQLAEEAAIRIQLLAVQNPSELFDQATALLSSVVREQTRKTTLRESEVCTIDSGRPKQGPVGTAAGQPASATPPAPEPTQSNIEKEREDPLPAAQAAIRQLGSPKFAALRRAATGRACIGDNESDNLQLHLENRIFDNFNLSGLDLSCAKLSRAGFRRVSLNSAKLFGADLRGATFADWEISKSPASTGFLDGAPFTAARIGFDYPKPASSQDSKLDPWQTYHCFIADLRYADLRAANFENGSLAGADLAYADLTGANLCGVDVSRANFTGAKGITPRMFEHACAGRGAQPLGLDKLLSNGPRLAMPCPPMDERPKCEQMNRESAYAAVKRPPW
ncbi:pentapeptide repeat-containing protein [Bradyrhizobium sp. SZCCHNS1054]|uniref:pentapeptide repeat-containing protein n=1 Tax=Bradyrhizobium sp. SZCCHNS1054 TaxID=3057301 RepID=UPI002916261A|nr:pentapeptide repeat-containing protein [Bradyrhizobium sp. SZCCHNS1054]